MTRASAATKTSVAGMDIDFIGFGCLKLNLFFAEVDADGHTVEIPHLAEPVLDKAFVGVADVLGQVAEEDKLGRLKMLIKGIWDGMNYDLKKTKR